MGVPSEITVVVGDVTHKDVEISNARFFIFVFFFVLFFVCLFVCCCCCCCFFFVFFLGGGGSFSSSTSFLSRFSFTGASFSKPIYI